MNQVMNPNDLVAKKGEDNDQDPQAMHLETIRRRHR